MQQAEQLGIRSTPSFVINGRLLLGAQPFSEFKRVIDYMISPP
jgi:protein-disulfide isomerase